MGWLEAALLAPFMWAVSNLFDKMALSRQNLSSTGFMTILSQLYLAFFLLAAIWHLPPLTPTAVVGGALLYVLYLLYAEVMKDVEVVLVVAGHQVSPLFVAGLAALLGQGLPTSLQLLAMVLIAGGVGTSCLARREDGSREMSILQIGLITLSAAVAAVATLLFDLGLQDHTTIEVLVASSLGYGVTGLIHRVYLQFARRTRVFSVEVTWGAVLVVIISGLADMGGYFLYYRALELAPNPGIVASVSSLHLLYVMLGSFFGRFRPAYVSDGSSQASSIRIIGGVALVAIGLWLLRGSSI